MRYEDIAGARFGKLTAIRYAGATEGGRATWLCRCDCGGEKVTQATYLKSGKTASCGCLGTAQRKQAASRQLHALSKSENQTEYAAWAGMLRRCYNEKHPSYGCYGGRGITVCDRWRGGFAEFFSDMGAAPQGGTVERIDNSKGYSPENCRWASKKEQANNRRSNRIIAFGGMTMNIAQWEALLGWRKGTIANRLFYGWPVDRALTEVPKTRNHRHTP